MHSYFYIQLFFLQVLLLIFLTFFQSLGHVNDLPLYRASKMVITRCLSGNHLQELSESEIRFLDWSVMVHQVYASYYRLSFQQHIEEQVFKLRRRTVIFVTRPALHLLFQHVSIDLFQYSVRPISQSLYQLSCVNI